MKRESLALAALIAPLLAACALEWKRLDGADFADEALQQALKGCRVERKLTALERAREERDRDLGNAGSEQAKKLIAEDFADVERQVYREIDTCMYKQGYRR